MTLFNAVPDGEKFFEVERLKETYGYPDKKDRRYKVLYLNAYGNKLNFGGIKYQYKLDVDDNDKKVYLCVYNKYDELLERKVYWSFEYLEERLLLKLKYLAIVNAWTNEVDHWNYFKYYKIDFYVLKSFETFLDLIKNGTIRITFKVGIYRDENYYGKTYNHGCGFAISEKDIKKLYYKYNIDKLT